MSEKDTKKVLSEQQRRQRELIELKRLQQEGGSLPNETEHEVLTTPTSKIKHFWYYYKWYVVAFILISVAISMLVAQCVNKIKYDYIIVLNSTEYIIDEDIEILENKFKSIAEDKNGDGVVNLVIINCSRNTDLQTNAEFNKTQSDKFQAQLADGTAKIFIVNKEVFDGTNKPDYMLWTDHFALPHDGKVIGIEDTVFASIFEEYEDEYYIGYRKSQSYDSADARLFQKFIEEYTTLVK